MINIDIEYTESKAIPLSFGMDGGAFKIVNSEDGELINSILFVGADGEAAMSVSDGCFPRMLRIEDAPRSTLLPVDITITNISRV